MISKNFLSNHIIAHNIRIDYYIFNIKGKDLQNKYNLSEKTCLRIKNNITNKIKNINDYKDHSILNHNQFETICGKIIKDNQIISQFCKSCNSYKNPNDCKNSICNLCYKTYKNNYYLKNKEKILKNKKISYIQNKEKYIAKSKSWQDKNKQYKKQYDHQRRIVKHDFLKLQDKNYYKNNKDKILLKNKEIIRRKYKNISFKLKSRISNQINKQLIKFQSSKKNQSILKYLDYTIKELKNHLESLFEPWMNWNNHGKYKSDIWDDNNITTWTWQIDHIIPQSDLPYTSMNDDNFKICWSLTNLRPYPSKQNLMDGISRTRHKEKNERS